MKKKEPAIAQEKPTETPKTTKTRRKSTRNTPSRRKKLDNTNLVARPLCFTVSYNRPYHLYNTILGILNQTFQNFDYSVVINIDEAAQKQQYLKLLSPFLKDKRLKLFFSKNDAQHNNYLKPIREVSDSLNHYNLFIKIDDDDIYYPDYIEDIITEYKKHDADIISCIITQRINATVIESGLFESIGVWEPDTKSKVKFGMPFSYTFNRKALDIVLKLSSQDVQAIHFFEDPAWRTKWRENKLKSHVIHKYDKAVYHIHGKNTSSAYLTKKDHTTPENNFEFLENDFCCICVIKHHHWLSYAYFNKRNNRMYLIDNDDHGSFTCEGDDITIDWDDWGVETFTKTLITSERYYYVSKD